MSFQVPYESSPPETPERDRSRSLWSNVSTTPAGLPPSDSFTQPTSHINGGSRINSFTQNEGSFSTNQTSFSNNTLSNSFFTKSGNINTNDSIFGSSFGSTDYAPPKQSKAPSSQPFGKSSLRFGMTNGSTFGESLGFGDSNGFASSKMTDFHEEDEIDQEQQQTEEEFEEEEEMEEDQEEGPDPMDESIQDPSKKFNFLDSAFGNPFQSEPSLGAQRKPIYSNPSDAKRPKLSDNWGPQSPIGKNLKPKKSSALPSILHNLASRSKIPPIQETNAFILNTEDVVGKLCDQLKAAEFRHVDYDEVLANVSKELLETWGASIGDTSVDRSFGAHGGIGPGEQAPGLVKATFLASLLLQIHHPPREIPSVAGVNPMRTAGLIKAVARPAVPKALPRVLLEWLSGNHAPQTKDLQTLKYVEPNPTASTNFWDIIISSVLRGRLSDAADVLRSADFNYARSALEDGLPQPGYRGAQLQNIQRCVNKVLQILESCPSTQNDDWDVTGHEWSQYRKRVLSAVSDLETFAEGEERDESNIPVQEPRFQAVNFGMSTFANFNQKTTSFAQSARMAESRVPWSIYQSLRSIYRIILGDPSAIKSKSQDWVEATITLTAWWDGEDDAEGLDFGDGEGDAFQDFLRSRGPKNHVRAVDRNMRDAYRNRLAQALSHTTTEASDSADFRPNTMNSVEVGLASVFEGNVQGVLELVQTWSLCVAATTAEIASQGGWFESGNSQKSMPGLSETDLMVLSYGQVPKTSTKLRKDDILRKYAFALYDRPVITDQNGSREGWELSLEVLNRFDDGSEMKKAVSEIVDKLPLESPDQLDRLVVLCSELELDDQGRRVSEVSDTTLSRPDPNTNLTSVSATC